MLLRNLKSLKQNGISTEKEKLLFLENQELISENDSLKRELTCKNSILKNIPFELKNNITILIGFSELLLKHDQNKLSEKQKQYLDNIGKTADLLHKAIEKIKLLY